MHHILVIDTGSSSMRGLIFEQSGKILFTEQRRYFMNIRGQEIAEQDPQDFQNCLTQICRQAAEWADCRGIAIDALSLTSQRSSIIPLSKKLTPLGPAMMWYDKRANGICEEINRKYGNEMYRICGMTATAVLSAPKIAWMKQNSPELYKNARKLVGIHDYLLLLLTGRAVTDYSLASRTGLMDIERLCWSPRLLELYGIDEDKLCELLPPGSVVGPLLPKAAGQTGLCAGTPVVTAGGDQQCSVLGQGLFEPGQVGVTTGTGAYLAAVCAQPVFDPECRVSLNASVCPGLWVLEASTLSSGSVYDWFNNAFYPETGQSYPFERIDSEIERSTPGAGGVLMLPDLAGKGCPDWDGWAHGVFYNLGFQTTRGDCARACLEGIAAEIAQCYNVLKGLCKQADSVKSTGGLAKFGQFNQIIADMIEFPVERCKIKETTAIGAMLAAVYALGLSPSYKSAFSSLAAGGSCTVFLPNSGNSGLYRRLNAVRGCLEKALPNKELSQLLADIPRASDLESAVK